MDYKKLLIDIWADVITFAIFLILGTILNYIGNKYNNTVENKKKTSPKFKKYYNKTGEVAKTWFEIIYRILSYIVLLFVITLSLGCIAFWIYWFIEKETITYCIFSIAIWLLIWYCWYLYIKSDKDYILKSE